MYLKQLLISLIFPLLTCPLYGQKLPDKISEKEFSIGKSMEIQSSILDEIRTLNIYLPLSYSSESLKTYPVIYLLDGSKDEDFIHISGIVQFGSFSWINMLPESIVVGIGNVDRVKDFTFYSNNELDQNEFPSSGNSEDFIRYIKKELQPFMDSNFRTSPEKTIIGQSLGGLLTTEILFKEPDTFDNYIIVSPSLWWDDESLLNYQPVDYSSEKSIYVAVGKEGEVMERTARELHEKLNLSGKKDTHLYFEFLEDKTHGDALHQAVYNAFGLIFGQEEK